MLDWLKHFFFKKNKFLIYWTGWFSAANLILFWLIGHSYLSAILPLDIPYAKPLGYFLIYLFVIITYIGYFGLFAGILWLVLYLCSRFLTKHLLFPIGIILASFCNYLLLVDTRVFNLYRVHLNKTFIDMATSGYLKIFLELSNREFSYLYFVAIVFIVIESLIAIAIWRWFIIPGKNRFGKLCSKILAGCLLSSYLIFLISVGYNIFGFSTQVKVFPLYVQSISAILPMQGSLQRLQMLGFGRFYQLRHIESKLHYPLHPLQCKAQKKLPNIIFIVLDTWRYNTVTEKIMPKLTQFSQRNLVFQNHLSGGNATRPGIFSLFYSIPDNYWTAATKQKIGPVFIKQLLKNNYSIKIITSSSLYFPDFTKNVFVDIPNIPQKILKKPPGYYDKKATKHFLNFLNNHPKKKPFFVFLFYDAAHGYCLKQPFAQPFQPAVQKCNRIVLTNKTNPIPYLNRYLNAVHFLDGEVAKDLDALQTTKLLDNTIVIITGDHGQEFNDSHQNYWEHASNFTNYQVQTPLLIHWPGYKHQVFNHLTSHYDIIPSLLRKVFNCSNPASDYSVGYGLFNQQKRAFILADSYINFGIITPKHITSIYPDGSVVLMNKNAKPLPQLKPNYVIINKALHLRRKFFEDSTKQ